MGGVTLGAQRQELAVGLFAIATLVVAFYATFRLGGCRSLVAPPGRSLIVRFDNAAGVEPRTEILVAGVRVGEVEAVSIEGGRARLDLRVTEDSLDIPIDSTVAIRSRGLLGERVVELAAGASDRLARDGDILTTTVEAPSLDRLLDHLVVVAEDVQAVARSLRLVLGGPEGEESVAMIIESLRDVSVSLREFVDENGDALGRAITQLDVFTAELARLAEDNGQTVGEMLESFASASGRMQDVMDHLANVTGGVEQGEGTLGKLLTDETLYEDAQASIRELKSALREVRRAAEEMQEQLPVTVLGSLVGTIF